jgi:hypothetical protein
MNRSIYLLLLIIFPLRAGLASIKNEQIGPRIALDGIACTVNGPERSCIFCHSDRYKQPLMPVGIRPGEDALESFAFNELMYQDWVQIMERQKMDPFDNAIVNSYIDGLCRQNNWSMSDLEKILAKSGYTLQAGIKELKKMYAINYMYEMKLQTIVIPEVEIVAYYEKNPTYKDARLQVQRTFIPFKNSLARDEFKKQIDLFVQTAKGMAVEWETPFWLEQSEAAEHLQALFACKVGTISDPLPVAGGYELFRVVALKKRTLVSLKKRYNQIIAQLRQQKAQEMLGSYKKKLFDSASIVYFKTDGQEPLVAS